MFLELSPNTRNFCTFRQFRRSLLDYSTKNFSKSNSKLVELVLRTLSHLYQLCVSLVSTSVRFCQLDGYTTEDLVFLWKEGDPVQVRSSILSTLIRFCKLLHLFYQLTHFCQLDTTGHDSLALAALHSPALQD